MKKTDDIFPFLLKKISSCPSSIFYKGTLPKKNEVCVSIVGTRKATDEGISIAKTIARDLANAGINIISGLALGIDGASHDGAILGGGKTFAVLANGLDFIYPRQHESLARKILESGGGIISEYMKGTPPLPHQFLERNRIVSGISIATVVVEAPKRSGSLATARLAIEEGRDVFIIPGPINNKNYYGSHSLIRKGARLVTSARDILEDLGIEVVKKEPELNNVQSIILDTLKKHKRLSVDNISKITRLETQIVLGSLTFLMIENFVEELNGKFNLKKQ